MKSKVTLILFLILSVSYTFSQDLVYRPKNPAFGGDTFNYQWLLSSAEAQNEFTEGNGARDDRSELDRFTQSLNNQLLSQISRTLFTEQFGDQGLTEGTYTFGSLFIEIFESNEGLVIDILDTNTGDQTQVIIPN